MIKTFFMWLAKMLLSRLISDALSELKKIESDKQRDAEREVINEENEKKYIEAKSRAEKIKAAQDLLNGVSGV